MPRPESPTPITSRQNQWFRRFLHALSEHDREIVVEGPKMVSDAIASGWTPIAVARSIEVAPSLFGEVDDVIPFTADLFASLVETKTSQGVVGLFVRPQGTVAAIMEDERLVVVLDGVQDPGNVGTIIRLAAAFDAAGVVVTPGTADPFGPKAIRSSAGAILNVPTVTATPDELLAAAARRRKALLAAAAEGSAGSIDMTGSVLIFGSEGSGVSTLLRQASRLIAIPTSGRVESLNVAASAAILLAQAFEQRQSRR
jgi:RNA methyltransferase, TrmH family